MFMVTGHAHIVALNRFTGASMWKTEMEDRTQGYGPTSALIPIGNLVIGRIAWELPQTGQALSWGGTLSTATELVFFGEDSGMFMAVDGSAGKALWQFQQSQIWRASPMTQMFDGKQYIAVAAGQNIIAFALGD